MKQIILAGLMVLGACSGGKEAAARGWADDSDVAGIDTNPAPRPAPALAPKVAPPPQENTYDLGNKNGGNAGKLPGQAAPKAATSPTDIKVSSLKDDEPVAAPEIEFHFMPGALPAH